MQSARSAISKATILIAVSIATAGCKEGDEQGSSAKKPSAGAVVPVDVEVYAPTTMLAGMPLSKRIDDEIVRAVRGHDDVLKVTPRMELRAAAVGRWSYVQPGRKPIPVAFELKELCDGIDPAVVAGEPWADRFRDWDAPGTSQSLEPCGPKKSCDSLDHYCDAADSKCHRRVPAVVSRLMLDKYNGGFAQKWKLPATSEQLLAARPIRFEIHLGDTLASGAPTNKPDGQRKIGAELIGISDHARPIGMTVPIQYVRRWNSAAAAGKKISYSKLEVRLRSKQTVQRFRTWLRDKLDLRLR